MAVVVSTLGLSPAIVTEFIEELRKRKVDVEEVFLAATRTSVVSAYALQLYFRLKGWNVKVKPRTLKVEDIRRPEDCRAFRVEMLKVLKDAVKRAGGADNVYVSLAGGRKTMPIDMFLAAMARGVRNVYHVVAPGVLGTQNILNVLSEEELKQVERAARDPRVKVSEELAGKVEELCRPEEDVNLVRVPIPRLPDEEVKGLEKDLRRT